MDFRKEDALKDRLKIKKKKNMTNKTRNRIDEGGSQVSIKE